MNQKQLAAALGLSPSMVSKLAGRGMPVDSVERAQRWRKAKLPFARMKGNRAGTASAAPFAAPGSRAEGTLTAAPDADQAVRRVAHLMQLASIALAADRFELVELELRSALREVPISHRSGCMLDSAVMDALTAKVATILVSDAPAADEVADSCLAEEDAEQMGAFWYHVAAGEIVPAAAPVNTCASPPEGDAE